jgi:amino acid adenylation domain-containing protein/non-ribosomal peptide synthase protein (TIGR01720 family)
LGRRLATGKIEFLGRNDEQVQIRGYRVELGEIESQLLKYGGIKEARVIPGKDDREDDYLCAYFVSEEDPDIPGLREYLQQKLPGYMIPAYFVKLGKMPLTPNRKIDIKRLPAPEAGSISRENYQPPGDAVEEKLVELWGEVLAIKKEKISIDSNFFDLGGHSLKAASLIARIHKELDAKVAMAEIFTTPTVRGLAKYVRGSLKDKHAGIEPVEKKEYYVLSPAQERLYILRQMELTGTAYNVPQAISMAGDLEIEKLNHAFKQLIRRHGSLRTSFCSVNEEPVQRIHEEVEFEIESYDSGNREERMPESIIKNFIRPFDLLHTPLLRVGLLKTGGEKYLLLVDMHHIISDGVSGTILTQDFIALYKGEELPPLRLQYHDYTQWQESAGQQKALEKQKDYWSNVYWGEIPVLNMEPDYPRPQVQSFAGDKVSFEIDKETTKSLNRLAGQEKTTLYTVLVAVFNVLLAKITGQEDIVIGTPVAGRRHVDLEQIMGMFVNTLALRNYPGHARKFTDFLDSVKENTLDAFENQDYPFEDLVENAAVNRDAGRNPLFDIVFTLQNMEFPQIELSNLTLEPYPVNSKSAKFDMSIVTWETGNELRVDFEYCTKLFKEETIRKFIGLFKRIIISVLENPSRKISGIEIIPAEEKNQILYTFNETAVQYPKDRTIYELFADRAAGAPGNIACVNEHVQLTYGELQQRAGQLANYLKEKGVEPDTIVAVTAERSIEMVVGILGILKAGGAYLPIDADYPEDRVNYMLADSDAGILLKGQEIANLAAPGATLHPHQSPAPSTAVSSSTLTSTSTCRVSPTNLAYIIYTSGSTGTPKGVMVTQQNVIRLVKNTNFVCFSENHSILQTGSLSFDASTFEIWGALLNGMKLYLAPGEDIMNTSWLKNALIKWKITTIWMTSPLFNQVSQADIEIFSKLKYLLVGGDVLSPLHINRVRQRYPGLIIINGYGPTENTTFSATFRIERDYAGSIPIGRPINNSTANILDKHGNMQPIGIVGELCAGGDGVARGYLNDPQLTAEKFDHDGYHRSYKSHKSYMSYRSKKLYKTGDLARWHPEGNIEFLGRIDHQVKIRGFRIETGEIETRLLTHQEIKEAVVVVRKAGEGDRSLCAYYAAGKRLPQAELREYLAGKLPPYMIPAYFVPLKEMPLTPNGKIDRKSLPDPGRIELESGVEYLAPRSEVEKILVEILQGVLGREGIGINDNFFEIGGDSIKTVQAAARLRKTGYEIQVRDIFENPQISGLAPFVRKLERIPDQGVISGRVPLTPVQHWFFKSQTRDNHHFNQAVMLYSQEGFEEEAVRTVFLKLQEYHDALRMTYRTQDREIIQENHGPDYPFSLQVFDNRRQADAITALETMVNRIQAGIDLETGPLMKLGLFHLEDGDRLLIVIHHLVIDGVSWRILFEDIDTLYRQYKKKQPLALPLKTDSFKSWSEKLHQYADSPEFLKQKAYWQELEAMEIPPLEKDLPAKSNHKKDEVSQSFKIPQKETQLLVTKVNNAFGTEVNDILLTALGLSVNKTFGNQRLLVAMEGHGREDILDRVDTGRTIGWYTSIYPLVLEISPGHDLARRIKETKETLRRVPDKGIGYGILEYLTKEENKKKIRFKLKPQVTFNYLGQFDADIRQRSFAIAKESCGNAVSKEGQRTSDIEISGIITAGQLVVTAAYNKTHYKPETVQTFLDNYKQGLLDTISFCASGRERELTPGDFTYPGLSIPEVEQLARQYPIEDIYILSPMQEGKLFYTFYNQSSPGGSVQLRISIAGNLEMSLFERSIDELFIRYDILRAAFVYGKVKNPVQLILKNAG